MQAARLLVVKTRVEREEHLHRKLFGKPTLVFH